MIHPTAAILRYFEYQHLPEGPLRDTSRECHELAHKLGAYLPVNAELTTGLRKLLEAKDCFVRARIPPKPRAQP